MTSSDDVFMKNDKNIYKSDCLFCKMANNEIMPNIIYENDELLAFLDIGPIREGHVQIIPRAHFEYFDDLPEELATKIILLGQKIAVAQKRLYKVERVGFLFTGGDIPHAHAHVVPLHEKSDITSKRYIVEDNLTFAPIPNVEPECLGQTALELRNALEAVLTPT